MRLVKISVRSFDTTQNLITSTYFAKDFDNVEQLAYHILDKFDVGPVYRILFALRFVDTPSVWLAPNTRITDLIETIPENSTDLRLELRMRFRPWSFSKMMIFDREAFEIIFAQIRYDFIHDKSCGRKKSSKTISSSILDLVATDLSKFAYEYRIDIYDLHKHVDPKDFAPHRVPLWRRALLFIFLRKVLDYPISSHSCNQGSDQDVVRMKKMYIDLFLKDACKDYGTETYNVLCINNSAKLQSMEIRVRFSQSTKDSYCYIETRLVKPGSSESSQLWSLLADMRTISYGTLKKDIVEVNRLNGRPFRIQFDTEWHAKSFLSILGGYYRLMKKWHFNFCKAVVSPDLEYLKKIKCHGPIGNEAMRAKLSQNKPKAGTFLIRRCREVRNRYIIDVIVHSMLKVSIDISYDPKKQTYQRILEMRENGSSDKLSIRGTNLTVTILSSQSKYPDLKSLVKDLQIKTDENPNNPPVKLDRWLPPNEYDDYSTLLLSNRWKKSNVKYSILVSSPSVDYGSDWAIDSSKLKIGAEIGRGTCGVVMKGVFKSETGEKMVAIKSVIETDSGEEHLFNDLKREFSILKDLDHQNIVKTLGIVEKPKVMLVVEYLPLGSLLTYIKNSRQNNFTNWQSLPIKKYASDIAKGMEYLEGMNIVHRDLALRNILLKNQNEVKICDFGLAHYLGSSSHYQLKTRRALPLRWYAPETLTNLIFDHKTDVWSYGVLLWEMYSGGSSPHYSGPDSDLPELLQHERLPRPEGCPEIMYNLMLSCWAYNPEERDKFSQVCDKLEMIPDLIL